MNSLLNNLEEDDRESMVLLPESLQNTILNDLFGSDKYCDRESVTLYETFYSKSRGIHYLKEGRVRLEFYGDKKLRFYEDFDESLYDWTDPEKTIEELAFGIAQGWGFDCYFF